VTPQALEQTVMRWLFDPAVGKMVAPKDHANT